MTKMQGNRIFKKLYNRGIELIKDKTVVFCGMVRNCASEVKSNIHTIEQLGLCFKDYRVVVFENNSVDSTKSVLSEWRERNEKVYVECNDFEESHYQHIPKDNSYYQSNSRRRIQKYVDYRNLYMEYLDKMDFYADYIILVDYDVAKIDVYGVLTSFGTFLEWDVITANGYSFSPKLKRRYHDTYALCESGRENTPQTEDDILMNREHFAFLRKGMPFIKVFSAYGGLAIFKRDILRGLRYKIIKNEYDGVEVRCEHFSIFKQLAENGYNKVYINPNMEVYYQSLSLELMKKKIHDIIHGC